MKVTGRGLVEGGKTEYEKGIIKYKLHELCKL
jgi:hypothetical protein